MQTHEPSPTLPAPDPKSSSSTLPHLNGNGTPPASNPADPYLALDDHLPAEGSPTSSVTSSDGTFVSAGILSSATSVTSVDDYASAVSVPIHSATSPTPSIPASPQPLPRAPSASAPRPDPPPAAPASRASTSAATPSSQPSTSAPTLHPPGRSPTLPTSPADALAQPLESTLSLSRRSSSKDGEDAWAAWQAHKRHFFILNSAGKPVFSRYGDENALAGFMAIIQAIMSVVQDQGDCLQHIQAGRHLIVFLVRGPLYLVAASCTGEPVPALQRQLELLHNQIIFIVTSSLEKVCLRNPGYDVRQLLGGTWGVLHALIRLFALDPCYLLEAMQVLPMPHHERRITSDALAAAVKASGAMYGVITVDNQIIALERSRTSPPLHPWDLLLLTNFIASNDSYRYRFGESFSPVCLPSFRASAFLHAYIRYLLPEAGVCLLLLSPSPEAFHRLADSRAALERRLEDEGVLPALQQRLAHPPDGRPRLDFLPKQAGGGHVGHTPMWHFLIKLPARKQAICPAFREPLADRASHKALVCAYARLHATAWGPTAPSAAARGAAVTSAGGPIGPGGAAAAVAAAAADIWGGGGPAAAGGQRAAHRVVWMVEARWALVAHVERDVEVYAAFDPLVDKEAAARTCDALRRHMLDKARLAELVLAP